MNAGIDVVAATSPDDLAAVRDLFRAFVAWHRARHVDDRELIDGYFDAVAFERELSQLPGEYGAPAGALLLARSGGTPAGCVALRRLDATACEMKRMFVEPRFQGRGVGTALTTAVIESARAVGYRAMLLDTSIRQAEAQQLYRNFGFVEIPAYYRLPRALSEWLVFMRLDLHR
jgi:GNAT superfamily N-acetyltransferase